MASFRLLENEAVATESAPRGELGRALILVELILVLPVVALRGPESPRGSTLNSSG